MSIIIGEIIFVTELYREDEKDGKKPAYELARVNVSVDRRFGGIDCKDSTVYMKKNEDDMPMINSESGKYIKEIDANELLKEIEFGYTQFIGESKSLLRGMLREVHDGNCNRTHILWSESYNSNDEKHSPRLSFENFIETFVSNRDLFIGSDKWFKIMEEQTSRYDAKYICDVLSNWRNDSHQSIAYDIYLQAL